MWQAGEDENNTHFLSEKLKRSKRVWENNNTFFRKETASDSVFDWIELEHGLVGSCCEHGTESYRSVVMGIYLTLSFNQFFKILS